MKQNVNHKNYFKTEAEAEVVEPEVVEPVVVVSETVEPEATTTGFTREELMAMTKKEQIDLLISFGLSDKEIKKLRYEKDRVDTLLWAGGD